MNLDAVGLGPPRRPRSGRRPGLGWRRLVGPLLLMTGVVGGGSSAFAKPQGGAARPTVLPLRVLPRPAARIRPPSCAGLAPLPRHALGFSPGEELAYELTFAGAYIGRFETKVGQPREVGGQRVLPLFGRARTSAFVAAFKTFEGRYQTMVEPDTLLPSEARVEANYGGDPRWEKIHFFGDHRNVKAEFLLNGAVQGRGYQADHPLSDILALLYQARTVVLSPGLAACQDVFGSRRLWHMTGKVAEGVEVDTPAGPKPAWRLDTVFVRAPHPDLLQQAPQRIELEVYVSQDAAQTPLRFVARTQGIEAEGKLVRWSLKGTSDEGSW